MLDLVNQHNNGPRQGQIFDNPVALCLALWAKTQIRLEGGGGGGPNLFMKGVGLFSPSVSSFFFPDLNVIPQQSITCFTTLRSKKLC